MLHQTLPVFFQFNHSSSPPLISLPPHTSLSSSHQVSEMEGKALKTSFWTEMSQELGGEDVWGGNGTNGVSGDDFFVDELLNFSKEEEGLVEEEEDKDFVSVSSLEEDNSTNSNGFSLKQGLDSLPASELSVPTDDIADLEWLSHFVDDSPFTDFSLLSPPPKPKPQTQNHSEPEKTGFSSLRTGTFPTPIPVKARTKRLRSSSQAWSTTSSSSAASASSSPTSCLIFTNTNQNLDLFYSLTKPSEKKQKKRHVAESGGMMQRRCSHCGVQKTPQWRTGPLGAKTLCNACGVRFKSGRLLPEYRPACSPTFSSEVHSNNHRKVLEMRKKKEMMIAPESGLAPAVQSF